MGGQNPRKRRRIAGERRPRPLASPGTSEEQVDQQPSAAAPGEAAAVPVPAPPPAGPTHASSPFVRRPGRRENSEDGGEQRAEQGGGLAPAASSAVGGIGRVPSWLLVGLAVLLAAVVVFDLVVGLRSHTQAEQRTSSTAAITSALRQAPTQAETAAVRVLAYDYQTLQQDADEAKSLMTPDYAATFQKTVDDLLKAPAGQVKAHVEADVKASGVVSADAATVKVMLFVDQTSQTTAAAEPQTYLNRVVFTMVKDGDRWLVDDVTAL